MCQWLRALAVLGKDQDLGPSTDVAVRNHLYLQFQRDLMPSSGILGSVFACMYGCAPHGCRVGVQSVIQPHSAGVTGSTGNEFSELQLCRGPCLMGSVA